jgi:hypothetical protein
MLSKLIGLWTKKSLDNYTPATKIGAAERKQAANNS